MQNIDTLLTGGTIVTMDADYQTFDPGAIAITGDSIVAVGPADELARQYTAAEVIDCTGKVVIPGLVNAHTHAAMTLLRGLADDLRLDVWLMGYIMPVEREFVSPEMVRLGTKLACAEMIRSGITAFADMYYFEADVAQATTEAGMRALCGQTILKFPTPDAVSYEDSLAYTHEFIQNWKDHPLIVPAVSPHAPYTCTGQILHECAMLAAEYDVPLHIHIAETAKEVKDSNEEHGMPVVPWVKKNRLFEAKVLAAHCVHLDRGEIHTCAQHNVGIAHNPSSNLKLASGVAPVNTMLSLGVNVGIGTDGPASNNDLDMFEEARLAAFLAKGISGDPTALPARQALTMATRMGAQAMHIGHLTGSLEPGKRADLVLVNINQLHNLPAFSRDPDAIYSRLIYASKANDVTSVMVNGQWLMRDHALLTLDETELVAQAQEFARRVDGFLIRREQSILRKLVAIGGMEQQESFEVQAKARIESPETVHKGLKSELITTNRSAHYHEYDTYFIFDDNADRLRIREDDFINEKGETTGVRYRLTLIGPASRSTDELERAVLLSRSRYIAPSPHTLRFYREYFQPTEEQSVEKDRLRWAIAFRGVYFFVNLDTLIEPDLGYFVEVKSRTWSRRDAQDKAALIPELLELLGVKEENLVSEDYAELIATQA